MWRVRAVTELFAILTQNACAENLRYGPNTITAGSNSPYFSTALKNTKHTGFEQVFKNDGSTTRFTILWTFQTEKTLQQRFLDAVCSPSPRRSISLRACDGLL
jgi:hypothetical protein